MGNSLNPSLRKLEEKFPYKTIGIPMRDPYLRLIDYDASNPPIIRNDEINRLEEYLPENETTNLLSYEVFIPKLLGDFPYIVFEAENQEFILVERLNDVVRISKSSDKDTILSTFGRDYVRHDASVIESGTVRDGVSVHNLLVYLRAEAQKTDDKDTVFWKECINAFKENAARGKFD